VEFIGSLKIIDKTLIWIPLGPKSSWRGEGIAQTIENILVNFDNGSDIILFISPKTHSSLPEEIRKKKGLNLVTMTWKGLFGIKSKIQKPKIYSEAEAIFSILKEKSKIGKKYVNLIERLEYFNYVLLLVLWTNSQRYRLVFRGYQVWIVSPSIPFAQKLYGVFVVNFWDPFVFYYRDFDDIFKYVYSNTLALLKRPRVIVVTQSAHNKEYLTRVMGIPSGSVVIIENGSPDYRPTVPEHLIEDLGNYKCDKPVEYRKQILLEAFKVGYRQKHHSVHEFFEVTRNLNILERLNNELSGNTKIILVSTQVRPYKGIPQLFEVLDHLIKANPDFDFRFIVTFKVPEYLRGYAWSNQRMYEILRTPNFMHALLYLLVDLVIHPSYNEGGVGAYPAYEGASLNVPAIMNKGPHTMELVSKHPDCAAAIFDIDNPNKACNKIRQLLSNREIAKENINYIKASSVSWADAGKRYQQILKSSYTTF
jgi:glycosyltransferase involved in cell wall biosynthesis